MIRLIDRNITVPDELGFQRLDVAAARLFPEYSRARLQQWIRSGELTVDGRQVKPREKLKGGEKMELKAKITHLVTTPENIDLNIVYEDQDILVLNKPAALVVHPGAGNPGGTLMNALLFYCPQLSLVPRAGIVHRLDKDTTGLMVVAKTLESQFSLVRQLEARSVQRTYQAVVYGQLSRNGEINAPIARHSVQRTKMAIQMNGKEAITRYRTLKTYAEHTHLQLNLKTGRTHQIRVHLAHLRYPVVGDPVYGGGFRQPGMDNPDLGDFLRLFSRQALHASHLSFIHPSSKETIAFEVPLPEDFKSLLALLEQSTT